MTQEDRIEIKEVLCESCTWYDGSSCLHEALEQFPFKERQKKCKYYEEYDSREDDYAAECEIEDDMMSELDDDSHTDWED